jgi:two-component system, OmpR family, sensor histidine kinase MtrB
MRKLGLRTRVTLLFAGGAALLTATLAMTTYELVRHNLLQERQRSAVRAAYFDAAIVQGGISSEDADVVAALRTLDTGQARRPLVRRDGTWYARNADDNLTGAVPTALVTAVEDGQAAVQRVVVDGRPLLVVGLPLAVKGSAFYEVQDLSEARTTLRTVGTALTVVTLVGTALAALLSWSVSRRALLPLRTVSLAAESVSAGDYTTRIPEIPDPDLRELTRSFNGMVDEVRMRVERERRFAAHVSHELRSPLQTLEASARVLHNTRGTLEPRAAAALDLLAAEIARFSDLVQSLLELARSDRPLRLAEVDVCELLRRTADRHHLPPDTVKVDPVPLVWTTDEQRLERVLDNLLDNARQHGGGVTEVMVGVREQVLVVDVDDAGPGVPMDERLLIFDRFARGRSAYARGGSSGSGLGLAIVAEHVAALDGWVEVLDRPGGGGRFRLHLTENSARPRA